MDTIPQNGHTNLWLIFMHLNAKVNVLLHRFDLVGEQGHQIDFHKTVAGSPLMRTSHAPFIAQGNLLTMILIEPEVFFLVKVELLGTIKLLSELFAPFEELFTLF